MFLHEELWVKCMDDFYDVFSLLILLTCSFMAHQHSLLFILLDCADRLGGAGVFHCVKIDLGACFMAHTGHNK